MLSESKPVFMDGNADIFTVLSEGWDLYKDTFSTDTIH
jgi:hypothetical protein